MTIRGTVAGLIIALVTFSAAALITDVFRVSEPPRIDDPMPILGGATRNVLEDAARPSWPGTSLSWSDEDGHVQLRTEWLGLHLETWRVVRRPDGYFLAWPPQQGPGRFAQVSVLALASLALGFGAVVVFVRQGKRREGDLGS